MARMNWDKVSMENKCGSGSNDPNAKLIKEANACPPYKYGLAQSHTARLVKRLLRDKAYQSRKRVMRRCRVGKRR